MYLEQKVVLCDGNKAGSLYELTSIFHDRDFYVFSSVDRGDSVIFSGEELEEMQESGRIKLWRNGLERAKDIAKSR